jgi:hypothetical protein
MNKIPSTIHEIESIFPERNNKSLLFEAVQMELRQQIREYCKKKGYYSQIKSGGNINE